MRCISVALTRGNTLYEVNATFGRLHRVAIACRRPKDALFTAKTQPFFRIARSW